MTQITLRGLNPVLEQEIRKKAKKSGKSLSRTVLDMLEKNQGSTEGKLPRAASLKQLAGGWNNADASAFYESIKIFKRIDKEMWE